MGGRKHRSKVAIAGPSKTSKQQLKKQLLRSGTKSTRRSIKHCPGFVVTSSKMIATWRLSTVLCAGNIRIACFPSRVFLQAWIMGLQTKK